MTAKQRPPSLPFRLPRLYAIIERSQLGERTAPEIAESLLSGGVRLIQYRDKAGTSRELYEASAAIAKCAQKWDAVFIVNDRADVARVTGASGVHLGQDDLPIELARRVLGPGQIIGASTHNIEQVLEAERSSADYLAFGPIFETASKQRRDPIVGFEGLRAARARTSKPLVAIGGITLENARAVLDAGADGVAVIRDLMAAHDVAARAKEFLRVLE